MIKTMVVYISKKYNTGNDYFLNTTNEGSNYLGFNFNLTCLCGIAPTFTT